MCNKTIAIVGTLDTKEAAGFFLKKRIEIEGCNSLVIDISGLPSHPALGTIDIPQMKVLGAAGISMKKFLEIDRGELPNIMSKGLSKVISRLVREGRIDGVIGYGGSWGMSVITPALRSLPGGFPKTIVTTVITKSLRDLIGAGDIVVIPSITDFGGKSLNQIEARMLANTAGAICGMTKVRPLQLQKKAMILATQMGVTTPCILECKSLLAKKGYELVPFHAIGPGGEALENLVSSGFAAGVLDVTLAEISNELLGGDCIAGPNRLMTAGQKGVPQIIVPGALDMSNYRGPGTQSVPIKFKDRRFYFHNPMVTLLRVNKKESTRLGEIIASKLNGSKGPTAIIIPSNGWSTYDRKGGVETVNYYGKRIGQPWYDREANMAFIEAIKRHLAYHKPNIAAKVVDLHINDPDFARLISCLIDYMIKGEKWKEKLENLEVYVKNKQKEIVKGEIRNGKTV